MGVEDAVDDIEFSKADYGSSAADGRSNSTRYLWTLRSLVVDRVVARVAESPGWAEFRRLDNAQDLVIAAAGLGRRRMPMASSASRPLRLIVRRSPASW